MKLPLPLMPARPENCFAQGFSRWQPLISVCRRIPTPPNRALRFSRKYHRGRPIPGIIVITGNAEDENAMKSIALGYHCLQFHGTAVRYSISFCFVGNSFKKLGNIEKLFDKYKIPRKCHRITTTLLPKNSIALLQQTIKYLRF